MSHWEEAKGKTQDTLEGLCLSTVLGMPRDRPGGAGGGELLSPCRYSNLCICPLFLQGELLSLCRYSNLCICPLFLQGELLSPCRCDGSVRCTHQPCLIRWISERGSWSCELCYFKYQVLAISTKNPLQWQAISLTVIEKVQIAAIILGSLFLIASISWLIWSSLSPSAKWQRQDLLFQICYGMYGFMDIVCIGLIIHEGSSVYRIFKRWQAVNQQWKVLNYEKSKDLGDPLSSGGKAGSRAAGTTPWARVPAAAAAAGGGGDLGLSWTITAVTPSSTS
ncbi:hypothetical protein WMY93_014304 [Mugilogobius chulae]|uniref:RING-type E3 ubiquitin transferase n=1 Tax=Mugilogobius chulae TaxID=88201 RepID=A0AAW0P672_9GOBI